MLALVHLHVKQLGMCKGIPAVVTVSFCWHKQQQQQQQQQC